MYFDSHAHYDDRRFDADRVELLSDLPQVGVIGVVNAGACLDSSRAAICLAEKYPYIYATVGVHPHEVSEMTDACIDTLKSLCKKPTESQHQIESQHQTGPQHQTESQNRTGSELIGHSAEPVSNVVAIGEIGLDFHYDNSPRKAQRLWFAKQLELAKAQNLPVVIHSREAAAETMSIIKESGVKTGVIHCYSGQLPMALEYVEMGFYIGLGGPVTYKNAKKTKEVAAGLPLDRLLIETDAPYLTPEPFRGKRNDSTKLTFVAKAIADLRGISQEEVARVTAENAKKLFGIY